MCAARVEPLDQALRPVDRSSRQLTALRSSWMSLICQFVVVFVHATISWDAPWAIRELIHFVPAIRELNSYICSNYFPRGHFPVEYMLGLRADVILQRGTMTRCLLHSHPPSDNVQTSMLVGVLSDSRVTIIMSANRHSPSKIEAHPSDKSVVRPTICKLRRNRARGVCVQ